MSVRDHCPACNSSFVIAQGTKGEKKIFKNGVIEFIQNEYSILKCKNCGLYFRSTILSDEQLNMHYSTYDYDNLHYESALFPPERFIKNYLKSKIKKQKTKILDYGCNEALFLSLLVQDFDCYGFEIDDRVKQVAEARGVKMLDDENLAKINYDFDFIILIDVFEHLKNPTETISMLVKQLKKNGQLIISTGYADAECCRDNLANYWYFSDCVQHLCMLGTDYVKYLSKTFGLNNKLLKSISHYDSTLDISTFNRLKFYLKYKIFLLGIKINKQKSLSNFLKYIPIIRKPLLWNSAPYYPPLHEKQVEKDHIVVILEKQ